MLIIDSYDSNIINAYLVSVDKGVLRLAITEELSEIHCYEIKCIDHVYFDCLTC